MTGRGFELGTVLGFPVRIHSSWVIIVFLLSTGLAFRFRSEFPALGFASALSLGLTASLLLFASVLAHELSHAVVARRFGVGINGITLFIFGGAAEMVEEPKSPRAELLIAIAGPLMSLFLGVLFGVLGPVGSGLPPLERILVELSRMNFVLVAFNIVPGFPLDGGRVLRAILWGIWGRLPAATRVAAGAGSFFGTFLVLLGLVFVFRGDLSGLWFVLIGFFLRSAAQSGVQQLELQRTLGDVTARELMVTNGPTVSPTTSLAEVVQNVMVPHGLGTVPVVEDGRLLGIVRLESVRSRERGSWGFVLARDGMEPVEALRSVHPDDPALKVLALLGDGGGRRRDGDFEPTLPVVENGRLLGLVAREDVLRRLQMRLAIGAGSRSPSPSAGDRDQAPSHGQEHAREREPEQDLEREHNQVKNAPEHSRKKLEGDRDEGDESAHEGDSHRNHQRERDPGQDP